MRLLVFGSGGQVGAWLADELASLGEVVALDRHQADLRDAQGVARAVEQHRPDIVVNAAAYTAVDRAESDADEAERVNAVAPGVMAAAARRYEAMFVHYSTDYVFAGDADQPYVEDDATGPKSVYGRTKLAGEQAVCAEAGKYFIFRTSWVYSNHGHNFLNTMLRLAGERDIVGVVDDQIGAPTYARAIARATADVLERLAAGEADADAASGIYHMTCAGTTSWHGFASAIFEEAGCTQMQVKAIPTEDYPTPAARPRYSVLNNDRLERTFGVSLPPWRDSLRECLQQRGTG